MAKKSYFVKSKVGKTAQFWPKSFGLNGNKSLKPKLVGGVIHCPERVPDGQVIDGGEGTRQKGDTQM